MKITNRSTQLAQPLEVASGMLCHITYTDVERELAGMARKKAMNRDVLYHGTRYGKLIMKTGALFRSGVGKQKVCFTRNAECAAYWALMTRDNDEGRRSILILDRQSLERRYIIEANPEVYRHTETLFHDEAEEEIWANVIDVRDHLIGLVSGTSTRRSQKHRALYREHRTRVEARLLLEQRLIRLGKSGEFRSSIPLLFGLGK
jgi:hypothetical protein